VPATVNTRNAASKYQHQLRTPLGVWFIAALLVLHATLAHAEAGVPDPADALQGVALVQALQRGGLVIYFRHADTGPPYPEQPPIDLDRCETQRNLNAEGRRQARMIGEQFRRLQIPVGEVITSEFCRCWQTAELAFGRYRKDNLLTGVSRSPDAQARRDEANAGLRKLLGTAPSAGTNTVLVSHGYNLLDLEGFHLGQQGEAAVYRPNGRGGYVLVQRVLPQQWAELATRQ
jgi:phosphohistidine phosphatase SixA